MNVAVILGAVLDRIVEMQGTGAHNEDLKIAGTDLNNARVAVRMQRKSHFICPPSDRAQLRLCSSPRVAQDSSVPPIFQCWQDS